MPTHTVITTDGRWLDYEDYWRERMSWAFVTPLCERGGHVWCWLMGVCGCECHGF